MYIKYTWVLVLLIASKCFANDCLIVSHLDNAPVIMGIQAASSLEEIEKELGTDQFTLASWETEAGVLTYLDVPEHEHLGFSGTMYQTIFDDETLVVTFVPRRAKPYISALGLDQSKEGVAAAPCVPLDSREQNRLFSVTWHRTPLDRELIRKLNANRK